MPPTLDLKTIEAAITALKSPNPSVRFLGFQALQKFGSAALSSLEKLSKNKNPYIAARAIWLLPHLGKNGKKKAVELLNSSDRNQRLVAYRSLRRVGENMLPYAKNLASDSDTGIRRDVLLSLRSVTFEKSKNLFVELAKGYAGKDKNYLEAIGLGAAGKENEVWKHLRNSLGFTDSSEWTDSFARITWRLWPSEAIPDLSSRAKNQNLSIEQRKFAIESIAFINHENAPDALLKLGKFVEEKQLNEWIVEWTIRQSFTDWGKYNVKDKLKSAGIFDAEAVALVPINTPEPIGKSTLKVADIAKLSGDPHKGKTTIMRCSMCHEVNGIGVNFGPRLQGWAAKQSKNSVIHAIVNPSQGIAHGFGGTEYVLKNGSILHGITEAHGDPAIVLSQGGLSQMVPRSKVKASKPMKRSLMLSAEQLGMTAQDVADVVAFMKGYN